MQEFVGSFWHLLTFGVCQVEVQSCSGPSAFTGRKGTCLWLELCDQPSLLTEDGVTSPILKSPSWFVAGRGSLLFLFESLGISDLKMTQTRARVGPPSDGGRGRWRLSAGGWGLCSRCPGALPRRGCPVGGRSKPPGSPGCTGGCLRHVPSFSDLETQCETPDFVLCGLFRAAGWKKN